MKILVISHAAANSAEYLAGIPGNWPRIEMAVDDKYELSADQINSGYNLYTPEDHAALKFGLKVEYERWLSERITAEAEKIATEKASVNQQIDQLEGLIKNWENVSEKERSDVLLKMFTVILQALRMLGADVPDIDKP